MVTEEFTLDKSVCDVAETNVSEVNDVAVFINVPLLLKPTFISVTSTLPTSSVVAETAGFVVSWTLSIVNFPVVLTSPLFNRILPLAIVKSPGPVISPSPVTLPLISAVVPATGFVNTPPDRTTLFTVLLPVTDNTPPL